MITWENVLACFVESRHEVLRTVDKQQEYWNEKTLYSGMIADDDTILYVVNASCMKQVEFSNRVAVIILKDSPLDISEIPDSVGNAICISDPPEMPTGLIRLNAKFQDQFKVGYILSILQSAIVSNVGIQKIVEIIAQFFREPVSLLDMSFRFIAKSQSYKPDNSKSLFPETHDDVGFDRKMLDWLKKEGVLEKLIHSNSTVSYTVASEKSHFIPIIISNIKVAYLILYTNNPEQSISKQYEQFFPMLSNMLSIEMAKDNFYLFNKGNYYNYIFSLILSDQEADVEDIRMRLQIYDYQLRENMYLIEIDTIQNRNIAKHKDQIADSIRKTFRNSFYIVKAEKIYFLVSRNNHERITPEEISKWEMTLKGQKLIAAITGPFSNFKNMQEHLREVELVLEAAKKMNTDKSIFTFEEYQVKAMITALQKNGDISTFLYKPVMDLLEYDKKHGTELVWTLKEFLKHPKEIGEICETLCIHKNTLYKRLDKIDSIMGCDYRSGEIIMRIELTMEILDMQ